MTTSPDHEQSAAFEIHPPRHVEALQGMTERLAKYAEQRRPLRALKTAHDLEQLLAMLIDDQATSALAQGATYDEVGQILEITRQRAHQLYSDSPSASRKRLSGK